MTALLLLGPWTPLLFQGEEFGASSPFLYFADVGDVSVRNATRKGRAELLAPFLSLTEEETLRRLPAPDDPEAFSRCKLDLSQSARKIESFTTCTSTFLNCAQKIRVFGNRVQAELMARCSARSSFVLRYFSEANDDRLLIVNFGERRILHPASEPLLAPPPGYRWETLWTSESPRYGGVGAVATATPEQWSLPAESTVALRPIGDASMNGAWETYSSRTFARWDSQRITFAR